MHRHPEMARDAAGETYLNEILVRCSIVPPGMEIRDPDLTLADLFIDSVGMLAIALGIEERYGLVLDEHNVPYLGPIGRTIEYINRLIEPGDRRSGTRPYA